MTELLPRHRYTEYNGSPRGHYLRTPEAIGLTPAIPPLQRTADGRIDYDHYLRVARAERARAIVGIFKAIGRAFTAFFDTAAVSRGRLNGPRHI